MNTLQIKHVLISNPVTEKYFKGVFLKDALKEIENKPKLIICNTDTSLGKGEHWILIYFRDDDVVEFFDSLGKDPSDYGSEFINFMAKYSSNCIFTTQRIQLIKSDLCGQYCCFYAHKRCQGFDMKFILNNFPSPDVINLFSKIYLKKYDVQCDIKSQNCICF